MPNEVAHARIKYKEYIRHGLKTVGQILYDVLMGKNVGKAVVIVSDESHLK